MDLYTLYYGKKKTNMRPIMTDAKHKCEAYKTKREKTTNLPGHHEIRPAESGATVWKKRSASRNGGWIGKSGFNHHT